MDIRSTLIELCDAFNAHDLDRIMSYFCDDCVLEMPRGSEPWGTRYEGKAAAREGLAGRFQGLPDVRYTDEAHYVDESAQAGMSTWTLTGTTRDGDLKRVHGCDFYTFRDPQGLVLEDRRVVGIAIRSCTELGTHHHSSALR